MAYVIKGDGIEPDDALDMDMDEVAVGFSVGDDDVLRCEAVIYRCGEDVTLAGIDELAPGELSLADGAWDSPHIEVKLGEDNNTGVFVGRPDELEKLILGQYDGRSVQELPDGELSEGIKAWLSKLRTEVAANR